VFTPKGGERNGLGRREKGREKEGDGRTGMKREKGDYVLKNVT